jgi:predicted DNA-binding protein
LPHGKEKMTSESLQAINCRIPKDVYEDMQNLLSNTQKSTAAFVKDAIEFYIECVKQNDVDDFKPLKIDQFAYNLNKKARKE